MESTARHKTGRRRRGIAAPGTVAQKRLSFLPQADEIVRGLDVILFEEKAREAEREAAQVEDAGASKANWEHLACSWRLLAERVVANQGGVSRMAP